MHLIIAVPSVPAFIAYFCALIFKIVIGNAIRSPCPSLSLSDANALLITHELVYKVYLSFEID